MKIRFYCDLYMSEELKQKKEQVIQKLRDNSLQPSVYVITLSQGEQNHLEFYSSILYKQHIYENTPVFTVGIAKGYDDALYMIEEIVEDIYQKTNDTNIREYILNRQKEYEEGRV